MRSSAASPAELLSGPANAASRDAAAPAPARLFRDRVELLAFAGLLDGLNGFSQRLTLTLGRHDVLDAIVGAGGISVAGWFAFYAVAAIALEDEPAPSPRATDVAVAVAMLLLALVPASASSGLGLIVGGAWLAATSAKGSRGRRVALLLIALTGPIVVGRLFLRVGGPLVLGLDAHLAAAIAGASATGNVVAHAGGGGAIFVGVGCSSLHNMSLALLLWAAASQVLRVRMSPALLATGVGAVVAVALVNILRLAAIVRFPDHFDFLHKGFGAELFGFASIVVAGLIVGAGIAVAAPRQA